MTTEKQSTMPGANDALERRVAELTAELEAANMSLRLSEARYAAVSRFADYAIITVDSLGKIVDWNESAEIMFGYAVAEVGGQPLTLLLPHRYHERHLASISGLMSGGEPYVVGKTVELVGLRGDKSEFPLQLSTVKWETDAGRFVTGIIRDITERNLAQKDLREREAELKEAQRVGQIGSWDWDSATDTITWSDELKRFFGLAPDQRPPGYEGHLKLYTAESAARLDQAVKLAAQTGKLYVLDLEHISADGARHWLTARGEAKRDTRGRITGFRGTSQDVSERKRAEQSAIDALAYSSLLIEVSPVGVITYKATGATVSANEAATRLVGATVEQLKAQNFREIESWKKSGLLTLAEQALATNSVVQKDIHLAPSTFGKESWFSTRFVPFVYNSERYLLGLFTDITERKRAEESLRESEEGLRAIFEGALDGILAADAESRTIVAANAAICSMLGYTRGEILRMDISAIHPRQDLPRVLEQFKKLLDGEIQLATDIPVLRKNGSVFYAEIKTAPIRLAGTDCLLGIFRDVTARKLAEASQRLAASVFDNALDAIMITDKDAKILAVNCAFTDITGYSTTEARGKSPRLLRSYQHDAAFYAAMEREIREVGSWRGEIWDKRKNGELYCELLSISAVRDERGEIINYCGIFADITEQKAAQTELMRLNAELEQRVAARTQELERANHELEAFSYSISHDLRAPLRHIRGFSTIVLEANEGKLDSASVDNLERIAAGARRMGELIDDLLRLSDISRREMRRLAFNLSEQATKVIEILARAHPERNVEVVIAPAMMAEGDPGLVHITMENLLGNAWKFTSRTALARVEIGHTERDGELVYFVRDNGAGFDMKYSAKLFGTFQRLHTTGEFEGTGIGLSIVQRIIARHEGRIWAEANPGEGAAFYFTLGKPGNRPEPD